MLRLVCLIAGQCLVSLSYQLQHHLLQLRIRLMPFSDDLLEILDPLIRRLNLFLLHSQLLFSRRDLLPQLLILMFQGQLPWLRLRISLGLEISHRSVHDVSDAEIGVSVVYVFVLHGLKALDLFFKKL